MCIYIYIYTYVWLVDYKQSSRVTECRPRGNDTTTTTTNNNNNDSNIPIILI